MNVFLLLISTLIVGSAMAIERPSITGEDAIEIYKVLTEELNIATVSRGDSPESACYNNSSVRLKDMLCEATNCYEEDSTADLIFDVGCTFKYVKTKKDFNQIRRILKEAGLSPSNQIFQD